MTVELEQTRFLEQTPLRGNVWNFSQTDFNDRRPQVIELKNGQISEPLQKLARGLDQAFINPNWQFTSVLVPQEPISGRWVNLVFVYTNPGVSVLSETNPKQNDLIRRDVNQGDGYLPSDQINQLLQGTNLLTGNAYSKYNTVTRMEKRGLGGRRDTQITYYQMGVSLLVINAHPIEDSMKHLESDIVNARQNFERLKFDKEAQINELKARMVANPIKLF